MEQTNASNDTTAAAKRQLDQIVPFDATTEAAMRPFKRGRKESPSTDIGHIQNKDEGVTPALPKKLLSIDAPSNSIVQQRAAVIESNQKSSEPLAAPSCRRIEASSGDRVEQRDTFAPSLEETRERGACATSKGHGAESTPGDHLEPEFPSAPWVGHESGITACKFSPNGEFLCSSGLDKKVIVWDVNRGKRLNVLQNSFEAGGHTAGISDVAWHWSNDYVCTASDDKTVKVWNCATGKVLMTLGSWNQHDTVESHNSEVVCVDSNLQGNLIASGSSDMTVRLWDVRSGNCVQTIEAHSENISSISFNWDGTEFVTSSYDGITRLWDTGTGLCLKSMVPPPKSPLDSTVFNATCARFSMNGKYILSGVMDSSLRLWNIDLGKCVRTYTGGHTNCRYAGTVAFDKCKGKHVFTGSENGEVCVYDLQTGDVFQKIEKVHDSPIVALDTHPSKQMLVYGALLGEAGTLRVKRKGRAGQYI